MKVYKFKNLVAFCRFFGMLGGCSDVHISVFNGTDIGTGWSFTSRLTVPAAHQRTRLFPNTPSPIPLMLEFVWVSEFNQVRCTDSVTGEELDSFRFPSYDDLSRYNIRLNTTPKENWERERERRADSFYVSRPPFPGFDELLGKFLREGELAEAEI